MHIYTYIYNIYIIHVCINTYMNVRLCNPKLKCVYHCYNVYSNDGKVLAFPEKSFPKKLEKQNQKKKIEKKNQKKTVDMVLRTILEK